MKARLIFTILGLVFVITLAIVIGQRLSAQAMAVMVGVVAGVAASIPTSLIVVWFATRTLNVVARPAASEPPAPAEQRIVVMAPQPPQAAYPPAQGYGQPGLYPPPALTMSANPRQFNVIGGIDFNAEAQSQVEVVWPR